MTYELGMNIKWSEIDKKCVVHFRGERYELPGTYPTSEAAMQAAEKFCRQRGWTG